MRSVELFEPQQGSSEIPIEDIECLNLGDVYDSVISKGYYAGQLEQGITEDLRMLLPKPYDIGEKDLEGWKLRQGDIFRDEELSKFWDRLTPNSPNNRLKRTVINYFRPYDFIPKHLDSHMEPGKMLEIGGADGFLEDALVFLYTAEGEKDILLYTEGRNNPPTIVRQNPGQILVFPMADVANFKGELLVAGLYHEVPTQDANCVTFTWEIVRTPIPPKY